MLYKKLSSLVLYNDSHNSFSYVVDCLMDEFDFDEIQSEQIAVIAHFKGKAEIKIADKQDLNKSYVNLIDLGLKVKIKESVP